MKPIFQSSTCSLIALMWLLATQASCQTTPVPSAQAVVETEPVAGGGDSGDDVGIWVHPNDRAKSLIIGTCIYHSVQNGDYYVIVTSPKGQVEQWRLLETGQGRIDAKLAREFTLNPEGPDRNDTIEGCVADDQLGRLYLAQEKAGRVWRVDADPTEDEPSPVMIEKPKSEDGKNTEPENAGNDNYKLVPWETVANLPPEPLDVDVSFDPRQSD